MLIMIGVMLAIMTALLFISIAQDRQLNSTAEVVPPTSLPTEAAPTAAPTSTSPSTIPASPTPTAELNPTPLPQATEPATAETAVPTFTLTMSSDATPAPTQTPNATPTPEPPPPSSPTQEAISVGWQRIQIEYPAISFEVPADWEQLEDEYAWSADAGRTEIGVRWDITDANWHSSNLLIPPFQLVESKAVNLGWSQGHSYLIQVLIGEEPAGVQRHIIVQTQNDLAYDFYASAQNLRDLAPLEETLDQMLNSITLQVEPGDPTEVSVQFLGSLLRGESGAQYLSEKLQAELESGRTALSLLEVSDIFGSYYVFWLSVTEEGHMAVQAELNYADDLVIKRVFTLINQDGEWRIDAIAPVG